MRCHLCFFLLFLELLISHFLLPLSLCLLLYFSNALIELLNAVTSFSQMLKHTVHPIGSTVSLGNLSAAALSSHSTLVGLSSRLDAQLMSQDLSSLTLCVGCSSSVLLSYAFFCLTLPPFFPPGNFRIFIPGLSLFLFTVLGTLWALLYYFLDVSSPLFSSVLLSYFWLDLSS